MADLGIEQYGVTDHLHTAYNLSDIVSSRNDFLAHRPPANFHFGVEVSCMDKRECDRVIAGDYVAWGEKPVYGFRDMMDYTGEMAIALDADIVSKLGVEFVVGGLHWPLTASSNRDEIILNYLEQQLFLINHPLVDILAHPWYSLDQAAGYWYRYRDESHKDRSVFADIPAEYNDALADTLIKQNKPAEINLAVMLSPYPEISEYLLNLFCNWKQKGVKFTFGSDLHAAHFSLERFCTLEKKLTALNFTEEDFVLPRFRS
jgi:histidinol phosphatase-like PHP family hydrolase